MEVIDLGLDNLEPISLNLNDDFTDKGAGSGSGTGASSFGGGLEFLMNDKKISSNTSSSNNINIDLGELDNLEKELNDLSSGTTKTINTGGSGSTKSIGGFSGFGNFFGFGGGKSEPAAAAAPPAVDTDSNLGHATSDSMGNTKTWDGYSKVNEVPLPSTKNPSMTDRERRRKKRAMIKKLEEWYEKGTIKSHSHFNMDSNYEEVEDEYETAMEDKRKKDSIKLQGWWFMTFVNSVEYANAAFDPFGLNLDGWGEQISEDLDSYEEIFSELHEKYKGGKLSPELSLLLRIGFSAAVVNFTNKALSSSTPAFNDVIKQSPELMKMFTNATVSSMSQNSPGFAFANNLMSDRMNPPPNMGPPPPPVETKSQSAPPASQRPGNMIFTDRPDAQSSNRPDIAMGRGAMFREEGIPVGQPYQSTQRPPSQFSPPPPPQPPQQRPEMRGPQGVDIDNILAGLKPKVPQQPQTPIQDVPISLDGDSMISISSLKDLQGNTMPKKSRRKTGGSLKNTVSLDI
jgi:hypothetical protein